MIQKTFHHDQVKFEHQLITEEKDGQRFYTTPSGVYSSVTTVTGWDKRKFFAEWRKNNPDEAKRTTNRGMKLHSLIEKYLNNEEIDTKKTDIFALDLFLQMKNEVDKIDNIRALETSLYSNLLRLAGRVDCIAEYDGQLSVIDFKGSTKPKRQEDIDNYFMQATAYAVMWQELTGQKINNIVILISCEDGGVQVFQKKPIKYVKQLKECIEKYEREVNATV
jgi:ATP-dependent exoDNAse (exonuclease V) beta subunit